jgi:hypothetical protein
MIDFSTTMQRAGERTRALSRQADPRLLAAGAGAFLLTGTLGLMMLATGSSADVAPVQKPEAGAAAVQQLDASVAATMSQPSVPFDRSGMRCSEQTWPYLSGPCIHAADRTVRMLPQGKTDEIITVTNLPDLRPSRELALIKQRPNDAAARAQAKQSDAREARRDERRYRGRRYRW